MTFRRENWEEVVEVVVVVVVVEVVEVVVVAPFLLLFFVCGNGRKKGATCQMNMLVR